MNSRKYGDVSLGLSSVDPNKISLEHNVPLRSYMIYRESSDASGAAQDASDEQKLLDKRLMVSQDRARSFNDLTRQRAKSNQDASYCGTQADTYGNDSAKVERKTCFEEAFEKVMA